MVNSAFSATSMFEALEALDATGLGIVGLVRPGDEEGAIALSPHSGDWIQIPERCVAAFQPLGRVTHLGESHHLVRLRLKRPDDDVARGFHDLLGARFRTAPVEGAIDALVDADGDAGPMKCYRDDDGCYHCYKVG